MQDYVTDTHGLIWYLEDSPRLSEQAGKCFDMCDRGDCSIYVPTICLVEIIYLQEKGRIPSDMKARLDSELCAGISGIELADLTPEVVELVSKVPRNQVPDMPDRIIAATALYLGFPLITRDHKIKFSGLQTIW